MKNEILGDRKKRRYDESLVDKVNAQFGEVVKPSDQILIPTGNVVIDLESARNDKGEGFRSSQDGFIKYFNEKNRVMISMPEVYLGIKQGGELLESMKQDCERFCLISSTRLLFRKKSFKGKIVHYFGSTVVTPVEFDKVFIPDLSKRLEEIAECEDEVEFLQALFNTKDDAETILKSFSNLTKEGVTIHLTSVRSRDDWTGSMADGVAMFKYRDGYHKGYGIFSSWPERMEGYSRGVTFK